MKTRNVQLVAICGVALIVGTIAFLLVRTSQRGTSADAVGSNADGTSTVAAVVPAATPDTSKPGWYVPYLAADAAEPPFQGETAGIQIMPYDESVPAAEAGGCPPGTTSLRQLFDDSVNAQPLGIRLGRFVGSVRATGQPEALECDGQLVSVVQNFDVQAGQGGGAGAGSVRIFRSLHLHRFWVPAPAGRWSEGEVGGQPVASLEPVIGTVGTSAVIVNDSDGYTALVGEGVTNEFLRAVAEEIEK